MDRKLQNIWIDTNKMRQKDDKTFAELLNRLRTGHQTQEDIKLLKNTKITNKHLKKLKFNSTLLSYSRTSFFT